MFFVFRMVFKAGMVLHGWLDRWAPSNRALAWIRRRENLKWGVPAMGVGLTCFWVASSLTCVIGQGGPSWLWMPVIALCWDGFRFLWIGPVCLMLLVRARRREAGARRSGRVAA